MMDYFEILGWVIEDSLAAICREADVTREHVCECVRKHLQGLQHAYFDRSPTTPQIPYGDPMCRLAYLFRHVAIGADVCEEVMCQDGKVRDHVMRCARDRKEVRVCAFGGGPGTEQLAVCNWLEWNKSLPRRVVKVSCCVLDRVPEWAESVRGINNGIERYFRSEYGGNFMDWPALPQSQFFPVDIGDASSFVNLPGLFCGHDLYVLNYVVSEFKGQERALANALPKVFSAADDEALFLFIDRYDARTMRHAKSVAEDLGLEVVNEEALRGHVIDGSHQKESLGLLLADVGESPRTTADAFWIACSKGA